jgi:hypothetical protein
MILSDSDQLRRRGVAIILHSSFSILHSLFRILHSSHPFLPVALICCVSGCSGITWRTDVHAALDKAKQEGRMVVVWYWKPFNKECDQMSRTVFKSEDVIKDMQPTIPVRLHARFSRKWGEQHGVNEVPSFLAIGPDGQVLRKRVGVMDTHQFLAFLSLARLSP